MNNWSVVRTRLRWEKKVAAMLHQKGVETFCPVLKCRRQWSDRMKTIEKPLLKSYVLVRVNEEQRTGVRLVEGVVNFEYRNGKPVVLKEKMVQSIREFQEAHSHMEVETVEYVRPGANGSRPAGKNSTAVLPIETLNLVLIARPIDPDLIVATTDKI